ncbi:hypothetical protein SAMN05192559_103359 [Halobacillus karajensis]|uniref:YlxP-like protein n=1 Tax=Halobacillus karajensis TaxID=195088 RepID=A0A024P3F9_9BACI|nr:DUF503 family protein [Halobacillus karajensis]CDQ19702.1 hypothetical protein BN982_02004 [Halobacillus karajensis]CDQ22162.1 hypothetical protein BN983_00365 [Halobacillus karajensis]CDQ28003.1 hypothetical protein BN981_02292 [Halobacillus karajensis]SEH73594.1 hypothetical protein SAMN05192559_103359 [Halobacillus karajensis]
MIVSAEVDCIIYDAQSLKNKRAVLKRVMTRLQNEFNIAVSELEFQDLWQRTRMGLVTIASNKVIAEQTMQQALTFIDSFPEIERTETHLEWL